MRLLYGDVTLALETSAFGVEGSQSDKAVEMTSELASLNVLDRRSSGGLSSEQEKRRQDLLNLLEPVIGARQ
jgi:hypothetical protein